MYRLTLNSHAPSKKLLWLTDLHLDAAAQDLIPSFFEMLKRARPDSLLVGGDIRNGSSSMKVLECLQSKLNIPVYFVFGNHDYYGHSIKEIRQEASIRFSNSPNFKYLTFEKPIPLSDDVVLIGHDGWADGQVGDFIHSKIYLNDYLHIEELKECSKKTRLKTLKTLGAEAAEKLKSDLETSLEKFRNIILLTHPPPFREVCYYKGNICDDHWAPHFVCGQVGDMLKMTMKKHPKSHLIVLCGHAHYGIDVQIMPNLRAVCGHSDLAIPSIQGEVYI
ncbi:MAG: metallophosphoesterase [Waddliaceae bacterium]